MLKDLPANEGAGLTEKPGGLQSMDGKRGGHDLVTKQKQYVFMYK